MNAIEARLKSWRENPVCFVTDELKASPDKWQIDTLRAIGDPTTQRISLQACAGPGKSALLAWIGWWFLSCWGKRGEHPKGAAVSITADNLKDNLWAEFSKWRERSEWLKSIFEWSHERIYCKSHPETWFIAARSWNKKANAEQQGQTLAGLHSKYVLHLVDEAGGIPPSVGRAAEQALSNCVFGKIIQAGNPLSHDGLLYHAATIGRAQWHIIRITGDPDDPNRSPRIDVDWARTQIALYGRDNPWVKAYILGEFPPASLNSLLGPDEVEMAMEKFLMPVNYEFSQKRLGVDVAREGDDRTVLFPRQGLCAGDPVEMRNARGNDIASRIALAQERWQWETCFVDDTGGFGGSVIDSLLQASINNVPVNFSGKADDPRYLNRRAEMWFRMAEWVKRGGKLPKIPGLARELTAPTYTFNNGRFQLEDKAQIKKRLGFSPDLADALALTFAYVEMPRAGNPMLATLPRNEFLPGMTLTREEMGLPERSQIGRVQSEWDPMREFAGMK